MKAKPRANVLYLYGIARDGRPQKLARTAGVDGSSAVEAMPCSGLVCWVSSVPRAEFADRLAENMEKLDWLAQASVRHQQVVSRLAERRAIVPARFGTIFYTPQSLEAHVRRRQRALAAALRRVAGADEWGVKVFSVSQPAAPVQARSGREYLQKKSEALAARERRAPHAEVRAFAAALSRVAADTAPAGKISGGQAGIEWQGSFLVRRSRRRQWQAAIARFARRWAGKRRIEITGPWPPYSFVSEQAR